MKTELEPQDVQIIVEKVVEKLKPYLLQKTDSKEDVIFDVPGLCEYLHVNPKWIHERTHLKGIPHYKLSNKQLRFRKKDVDKWLDSVKMSAINSLPSKVRLLK